MVGDVIEIREKKDRILAMKVSYLLEEAGTEKRVLDSPEESFERLKECLAYYVMSCPEELESIYFYNNKKYLSLSELKDSGYLFKYEDFRNFLEKEIGIRDIREAFVGFARPENEPIGQILKRLEEDLIINQIFRGLDQTFEWFGKLFSNFKGSKK